MERTKTRTIALTLEYDGGELSGWQRQNNGPSAQEHLERAVAAMVGEELDVIGASRTDAGVHALGQVAHFRTADTRIPEHGFRRGLNSLLPPAIAVVAASEAPPSFHARHSASGKRYRYDVLTRPERSPLLRARAWHRPRSLDTAAMRRGAELLTGEHDFSAFRSSGCAARHPFRRIRGIDIHRPAPDRVAVEVRGDAFLRKMVRIIAGTLVEVGEGKQSPEGVGTVLASRDRRRAGITAPAHGLTLVEVFYEGRGPPADAARGGRPGPGPEAGDEAGRDEPGRG